MKIKQTKIKGCVEIETTPFKDERGSFQEIYSTHLFEEAKLPISWAQENLSVSKKGVLRGLHIQRKRPPGKLVRCVRGDIYDVCVDMRPESTTMGKWYGTMLSSGLNNALYIPPGCAHGFYVLGEEAVVIYKCTTPYDKESDGGVLWNDPYLNIDWLIPSHREPTVSVKDQSLPKFNDYFRQSH